MARAMNREPSTTCESNFSQSAAHARVVRLATAWHAVQTENGMLAEHSIYRLGFRTFYPKARKEEKIVPYISGYIFVEFDKVEDIWEPIQWARGVRVVPGWPARVRTGQLDYLLKMSDEQGHIDPDAADKRLFEIGQQVTLPLGTFAGFGTIKEIQLKRLSVMVEIFGRPTLVDVEKKFVNSIA